MSTIGSFGTFTTARLAIYVSQKGLSVTGNNIANINTVGYTRQRLDQVSFKTGMSDRYQNAFDKHVGNGAIAQSVSQLRDPYLDIRYRAEHSSEGFYTGKLSGLSQIADILDEIGRGENDGDGLLYGQFSDFFDAIQHIQVGAGTQVNDTLASTSAEKLCQLFYNAANQLERLKANTEVQLSQEIDNINSILVNIRGLNEAIQQAEIYGDGALELRDQRNNMIDALSEKLKIEATYSMVDFGGKEVEKLTIRLGNANPDTDVNSDSSLLVDGNFCAQLTTPLENEDFQEGYQIFDQKSPAYEQAVQELNAGRTIKDPTGGADFTKKAELDAAIDAFFKDPANIPDVVMKPYQFLDPNEVGTNDPRAAKQVFDEGYNITVSDLRDENNKAWISDPVVQDTYVKDTTGFPTRAKYEGTFKFFGTWKDGDKITIGTGADAITLEVGKDITADDANGNAKNVSNAIRKAMLDSKKFNDFEITTRTTRLTEGDKEGFSVQLTVKAKKPGQLAEPLPAINISAVTTANDPPSASIGAATADQDKDGKVIPGQFIAEVTAGTPNKFNKNDTITVGTAPNDFTLTVGKEISVNAANDPVHLAEKLAKQIKLADFTVKSTTGTDGKAYLVFTGADNAQAPTVPLVAAAAKPVEFTGITDGDITNGTNATVDTNGDPVNLTPDPVSKSNGDNTTSRVLTRYYMDDNDKWHQVVKTTTTSNTTMLDDNDLFGKLQAVREQLTEEGEFASQADIDRDESASIKRGIPYYQQTLDLLARQFAKTMNEANNGFAMDQNGYYLTSSDDGKTFEKILVEGEPLSKTGMTDDQKDAVEADALENFIRSNFAGFVKDAEGNDTKVLADKYGNPLTLGRTELTKDMLTLDNKAWGDSVIADAVGVNEKGQFVKADGSVITEEDPANPGNRVPVALSTVKFTDTAFGTPPTFANPTPAEEELIKKAEAEIAARKTAAEADMNDQALNSYLAVNGGYKMGGNLFSNRGDTDDDTGITAGNISVSHSWSHDNVHVVPTYIKLFDGEGSNTTQQDNALHMGNLLNRDLLYDPQDLMGDAVSTELFVGSFQELLVKMSTTQGNDQGLTKVALETHQGQALDIDTSRDSVSAVDLNDEAMNLMSYTHSLNAAYRLMTTIDDMIERLITGTGVTR